MYILTIYTLIPWLEIEWQQASADEAKLKQAAIDYFSEQFFEPDETQSPEQQFEELKDILDSGEGDDPKMELRKADG
jgi:hypothetical protein